MASSVLARYPPPYYSNLVALVGSVLKNSNGLLYLGVNFKGQKKTFGAFGAMGKDIPM
jgi:hypothetical protein